VRFVDIVGLHNGNNGRSCERHEVCGRELKKNDLLLLRKCIVEVDGKPQGAIAAIQILNGQLGCRVGFIGRHMLKRVDQNILVQVTELYDESELLQDRQRSYKNCGMALCCVLQNQNFQ